MIPFVGPSYQLNARKASAQRSVNWFLVPMETQGKARFTMERVPGLTLAQASAGEPRGCKTAFQRFFCVFASTLYELISGSLVSRGTLLTSTGAVSIDYGVNQLVIVDGENGYVFDLLSGVFARITDADFNGADTVAFQDNYFVFSRARSGQQWQWSAISDATSIDALDFFSAERAPDDLVGHCSLNGELVMFGERTAEVWTLVGGNDVWARNDAYAIEVGLHATHSLKIADNSAFFVGSDANGVGIVYVMRGFTPQRISTKAVEEALATSTGLTAATGWTYQLEGRVFYGLNAPGLASTWVYEVNSGAWFEQCDQDEDGQFAQFRAHSYALWQHRVHCIAAGGVYEVTGRTFAGDEIVCERTSPHEATPMLDRKEFSEFVLDCTVGDAQIGEAPFAELSWSDDGGRTFGNPVQRSVGLTGEYMTRAVWHRLGMARDRVWRLRYSDAAPLTLINGVAR